VGFEAENPSGRTLLKKYLLELLARSGPISFEQYMEICLYHPEHGYYAEGRARTGVRGDYFTSSDLHPVFARLLGRQAEEMWRLLGRPPRFTWAEMGAGRGAFASDFLSWTSTALPEFFAALDYVVVEPAERARLSALEKIKSSGVRAPVRAAASVEELEPVTGAFFSNELADAFPVAVVTRSSGRLKEIYVAAEGGELREKLGAIREASTAAAVARYAHRLEEGQRVEVSPAAGRWIRSAAEKLCAGFLITIDYGDWADRLVTSARPRGTLISYFRHRATENFFVAPGEQDLTAHVNFSLLRDSGAAAGLDFTGFTTQERFLLALGEANEFRDLYDPWQSEIEKLDARLKLKRLIHPQGMGGVFKVLVQHRGVARPKLTGLGFEGVASDQ
jgi:SAM-dependent MidA family methyltransferase